MYLPRIKYRQIYWMLGRKSQMPLETKILAYEGHTEANMDCMEQPAVLI